MEFNSSCRYLKKSDLGEPVFETVNHDSPLDYADLGEIRNTLDR